MTELSSVLGSLTDFGSTKISLLFTDYGTTILFSPVQGKKGEQLLELPDCEISDVLKVLTPMGRDFHSVTFFSATPQVTCIPDGLFDVAMSETYLDTVFGEQRGRKTGIGHVPAVSLHYVFGIDDSLYSAIQASIPQARIKHLCEAMLIEAWAQQDHGDQMTFRLHQEGESLFLLVIEGKELKLFTHHRIADATDVVYHSLNTIHAMGLDHDKARLSCSGSLLGESEAFGLLESYCPQCNFQSADFLGVNAPHQFILAAQSYCE